MSVWVFEYMSVETEIEPFIHSGNIRSYFQGRFESGKHNSQIRHSEMIQF